MGFRTLLTLATIALAAAETTVVNLFIFDADPQSLIGSVIASSAGTTTYGIDCDPDADAVDCGFLPGLMYTTAPSSIQWNMRPPYDRYGTVICSVGGTTTAVCTERMPTTGSLSQPSMTTTLGPDEISQLPVTITGGPSASTTGAGGSGAGTSEGSGNTAHTSGSSSPQTTTSTGGLPQITADPRVVLGGAAAALVAVAL